MQDMFCTLCWFSLLTFFCEGLSQNILTEQEEVVDQWPCTVSTVSSVRLIEIQNYRYTKIQFGNSRNTEQEEAVDQ